MGADFIFCAVLVSPPPAQSGKNLRCFFQKAASFRDLYLANT
jgi:hypothetical protein